MSNPLDLTGQHISDTYQRILQTDGGFYYDGLGNTVSIGTGVEGPQGSQGPQGYQGATGPRGDIGFGFQGPTGTQGFQGWQGPQGWQGDSGYQGSQGLDGPSLPPALLSLFGDESRNVASATNIVWANVDTPNSYGDTQLTVTGDVIENTSGEDLFFNVTGYVQWGGGVKGLKTITCIKASAYILEQVQQESHMIVFI